MPSHTSRNRRTRLSQQDKERYYFELFRKSYTLPEGEVCYGDKPDVTITGAHKLGIEITNFYHEDGSSAGSEQRQASRRTRVASLAQTFYLDKGGKNIELKLSFNKSRPIEDTEAVARNVAEFASHIEHRKTGQIPRNEFDHIPELDFVYVLTDVLQYRGDYFDHEFPDGQPDPEAGFAAFARYRNRREAQAREEGNYKPLPWDAKWQVMQTHDFDVMAVERLREILREKEEKAQQYRPCDAYWLLVVVDWMDPAQEQEIRVDGISIRSDVFGRVIIYKPHFEHIVDVLLTGTKR
ncbi:MAG: hypothetical protein ACRDHZ_23345 [Ktedonobacteraceae bacterium]